MLHTRWYYLGGEMIAITSVSNFPAPSGVSVYPQQIRHKLGTPFGSECVGRRYKNIVRGP